MYGSMNMIDEHDRVEYDRIFWIYFIITFFFVIIGMVSIFTSNDRYNIFISIVWLLSNVILMIITYHASMKWMSYAVDYECLNTDNRVWICVNLLFIVLLIISTLWAGELYNNDAALLRPISGILVLLGGLALCGLCSGRKFLYNEYVLSFWLAVAYIVIWFGLTLYVVITSY